MGLLRTAVAVIVALGAAFAWWEYRYLLPKPPPPRMSEAEERQILDEANFDWIVWSAADDFKDIRDKFDGAISIEMEARRRAVVVEREENGKKVKVQVINVGPIVQNFQMLMLPDECRLVVVPRTMALMRANVPLGDVAAVSELFRAYLANREAVLNDRPWLRDVRRYYRTRKLWWLPPYQNREKMRQEMNSLYVSPGGAEFFSFKPDKPPKKCD